MGCNKCKNTEHKCVCTKKKKCVNENCSCVVRIGSDCWTYTGDDLECSGIKKDTIGTEAIQQIDSFICDKFNEVQRYFVLKNIGGGVETYKGINLLGEKELRTFTTSGNLLDIIQNLDTIGFSVNQTNLTSFVQNLIPSATSYTIGNLSSGAKVYKDSTTIGGNVQFNLRSILNSGNLITVTENTNDITLGINQTNLTAFVENLIPAPTTSSTYSVSNLSDGAQIYKDSTVIGNNTQFNIRSIKSPNLTVTQGTDDITITAPAQVQANVLETTTSNAGYIQNKNPSKTVTLGASGNYNVTNADNNYVIEVDNGANNVTISFSSVTATSDFFVGFVQKGTGTVTFSGYTILPSGFTPVLYGQGHPAALEVINSTKYLHGTLIKTP